MKKAVLYIHGKGGSPSESEHYRPLFHGYDVIGLGYHSMNPWDAEKEFYGFAVELEKKYDDIVLIANSIGAYFAMCARVDRFICQAYFISPIVDMGKLIEKMMTWEKASEEELRKKGTIPTAFGEDLSWEYLSYVRSHPVEWSAPTRILYGSKDELTDIETMRGFAEKIGASLTVMEEGEHWFHTEKQTAFLDAWIKGAI